MTGARCLAAVIILVWSVGCAHHSYNEPRFRYLRLFADEEVVRIGLILDRLAARPTDSPNDKWFTSWTAVKKSRFAGLPHEDQFKLLVFIHANPKRGGMFEHPSDLRRMIIAYEGKAHCSIFDTLSKIDPKKLDEVCRSFGTSTPVLIKTLERSVGFPKRQWGKVRLEAAQSAIEYDRTIKQSMK